MDLRKIGKRIPPTGIVGVKKKMKYTKRGGRPYSCVVVRDHQTERYSIVKVRKLGGPWEEDKSYYKLNGDFKEVQKGGGGD